MVQQPEYLSKEDWQFALDQMCPWTTPPAVVEAHLDAAPIGLAAEAHFTRQAYHAERQWLQSENAALTRVMGPEFAQMLARLPTSSSQAGGNLMERMWCWFKNWRSSAQLT